MDNDSTRNGGLLSFPDTLSPLDRAKRGLQAHLSLLEVAKLTFPGNGKLQQSLVQTLISNAKAGNLPVYGNPDGWWLYVVWEKHGGGGIAFPKGKNGYADNPYPLVDAHICQSLGVYQGVYDPLRLGIGPPRGYHGACCLVSRADYFAFLKTPWARGIPLPEWPDSLPVESLPVESLPVESSLPEPSLPEKRQRDDALSLAIRAALGAGVIPRPRELFDYLKASDTTQTITGVSKDSKALLWESDSGSLQKTDIRAMAKRLKRMQNGG